jgi:hypothetical protein
MKCMGRSVLPLALWLGGCFHLDDPAPPAGDDAPGSDALADARLDGAPSDATPLQPFGPPVRIAELSAAGSDDDDPTMTDDLLEIYFNSNRLGGLGDGDIWRATRAAPSAPWGAPINVAELNTVANESSPKLSGDGLTVYFTSQRDSPSLDVWAAARQSRDVAWGTPVRVGELSGPGEESSPAVSPDGLHAVLSSAGFGNGPASLDFYETARPSAAVPWEAPALIATLSTPEPEGEIWFDAGGRTVVFASERALGLGAADLWTATRPGWKADFASIVNLAELNTSASDNDAWFSPDQRTIVFASTRGGDYDLYQATR